MSPRGRKASLPPADHARPEYVSSGGLVVHHYNREGRVRDYDFSALPVAEPMQRSLAALFAARCVRHHWSAHATSKNNWVRLQRFARFLSQQDDPPQDVDGLTVALVKRWRQASDYTCSVRSKVCCCGMSGCRPARRPTNSPEGS